jgi:hypothetical protein
MFGDQTCVFQCDPETKCQSLLWKILVSLNKKERKRQNHTDVRFISGELSVMNLFLKAVSQTFLLQVKKFLLQLIPRKGANLWSDNWILHHYNAPS